AVLTVPLQGAADAFAQSDGRCVAEFPLRAADIERPALAEKVDAPPVDGRRHAERCADDFTSGAGEPHGPHGQPQTHAGAAGDFPGDSYELAQRGDFPTAEDIRAPGGGRYRAAQP